MAENEKILTWNALRNVYWSLIIELKEMAMLSIWEKGGVLQDFKKRQKNKTNRAGSREKKPTKQSPSNKNWCCEEENAWLTVQRKRLKRTVCLLLSLLRTTDTYNQTADRGKALNKEAPLLLINFGEEMYYMDLSINVTLPPKYHNNL